MPNELGVEDLAVEQGTSNRFAMEGIVIRRSGEHLYSIIEPTAIATVMHPEGVDVHSLLCRLGGRRRHTNNGSAELREALFAFLAADEAIPCLFCGQEAEGLHPYFLPFCRDHAEIPYICRDCSSWTYPDDFNVEEDICSDCLSQRTVECNECGDSVVDYETVDGEVYCRSCYDSMRRCSNCGHRLDEDDGGYCTRCQRRDVPIHEAHAKVVDILGRSRYGEEAKDRVYFGIELELEVSHTDGDSSLFQEAATAILDALGRDFIILKTDGSLGDGGIEINTLPCTLKVQREKWEGFFAHKPSGLTSWKNNRCGIHIHITRQPLGMLTIGKMTVFLNDPKNKDFIKQIAGRYDASYSKVKPKKITDTAGEDRYEMLNLTSNRTIEMRIFKGTLNKRHFLADVEFAHALVHFCRTTSIRYLDTAKFMQFLRMNRKDYPNLYAFSCKEEKGEDE